MFVSLLLLFSGCGFNDNDMIFILNPDNITTDNIISWTGNISFWNNNYTRTMMIREDGKVGIGTTTPDGILDVTPDNITNMSYSYPFPRVTTAQRNDMLGMSFGANILDTTIGSKYFYDGSYWRAEQALNQVIINSMEDFPAPINGTITLVPNTKYIVTPTLFTTNNFLIPGGATNIHIEASIFGTSAIVYLGTGTMINSQNFSGLLKFHDMTLLAPIGTAFNMSGQVLPGGLAGGNGFLHLTSSGVFASSSLGTLDNVVLAMIFGGFFDFGDGLVIKNNRVGTLIVAGHFNFGRNQPNATLFTFKNSIGNFQAVGSAFKAQPNETMFNFESNLTVLEGVSVTNNIFGVNGTNFANNSLDQTSLRFKFIGNSNVPDSSATGRLSSQDNTKETVINGIDVAVKINATYGSSLLERFNATPDGRLTYIGLENISATVHVSSVLSPVSGQNILLGQYITKNGVVLNSSETLITASSNRPQNAISVDLIPLSTGDYIEGFVANEETTSNIIAEISNILIKI